MTTSTYLDVTLMLRKRDFVVYIANIDYYYNLLYGLIIIIIILYIHVPHVPGSKNLVVLHVVVVVVRQAQVFDQQTTSCCLALLLSPSPLSLLVPMDFPWISQ